VCASDTDKKSNFLIKRVDGKKNAHIQGICCLVLWWWGVVACGREGRRGGGDDGRGDDGLILPEPVLWTPKNLITVMLLHIEKASLCNEHFGRSPITSPTVQWGR